MEAKDIRLGKAKLEDWKDLYVNIWSRPESARYMLWRVTENEEEAKIRIEKSVAWQEAHEAYTIYEKKKQSGHRFCRNDGNQTACLGGHRNRSGSCLCRQGIRQTSAPAIDGTRRLFGRSRIYLLCTLPKHSLQSPYRILRLFLSIHGAPNRPA